MNYYQAILPHGDEKQYHFKRFLDSLPEDSRILLNGVVYDGGWHGAIDKGLKNSRHGFIFESPHEGFDTKYFSEQKDAQIRQIGNRAGFRLTFQPQFSDIDFRSRKRWTVEIDGTVEEAITTYNAMKRKNPKALLIEAMGKPELRSNLSNRTLTGNFKLHPTYVICGVGVFHADGVVFAESTGPYRGTVPKGYFS
jgi:hypothetical protein